MTHPITLDNKAAGILGELSLFTGYSGISLGVRLANLNTRTIAYVEWEKYPQEIIKARIKDGYLDDAPIFSDISSFRGAQFRGMVDLITAGFPCQPHSVAGVRKSSEDSRNKWPDTLRVIREVAPRYVLLENVSGLLSSSVDERTPAYGGVVVGQLTEIGYDCFWEVVGADDVGAPHRRKRWFCFAVMDDSNSERLQGSKYRILYDSPSSDKRDMADSDLVIRGAGQEPREPEGSATGQSSGNGSRNLADSEGIGHRGGSGTERGDGERIVQQEEQGRSEVGSEAARRNRELADSNSQRGTRWNQPQWTYADDVGEPSTTEESRWGIPTWPPGPSQSDEWGRILAERPDLSPALTKDALAHFRGVDNGRSHRVDELKALGNGVVPAVVAQFLRTIVRGHAQ